MSTIPNELIITINTSIPGYQKVKYKPSMTNPDIKDDTIFFYPLVKLHKDIIDKIPENFRKKMFFTKGAFESLLNYNGSHVANSIITATRNGFVDNNIKLVLDTLFPENTVINIGKEHYTIADVQWTKGDWKIDIKEIPEKKDPYKFNPLGNLSTTIIYGNNYSGPVNVTNIYSNTSGINPVPIVPNKTQVPVIPHNQPVTKLPLPAPATTAPVTTAPVTTTPAVTKPTPAATKPTPAATKPATTAPATPTPVGKPATKPATTAPAPTPVGKPATTAPATPTPVGKPVSTSNKVMNITTNPLHISRPTSTAKMPPKSPPLVPPATPLTKPPLTPVTKPPPPAPVTPIPVSTSKKVMNITKNPLHISRPTSAAKMQSKSPPLVPPATPLTKPPLTPVTKPATPTAPATTAPVTTAPVTTAPVTTAPATPTPVPPTPVTNSLHTPTPTSAAKIPTEPSPLNKVINAKKRHH